MLGLAWTFLLLTMASAVLIFLSTFFQFPHPLRVYEDYFLSGEGSESSQTPAHKGTQDASQNVPLGNDQPDLNRKPAGHARNLPNGDERSHPVPATPASSSKVQIPTAAPNTQQATASENTAKPSEICPRPARDDGAGDGSQPDDLKTNFGLLSASAFKRGDYEWSCYLVLRQKRYDSFNFWRVNQAYLAGALYKMGRMQDGKEQLDDLVSAIVEKKQWSKSPMFVGWAANNAAEVGDAMPPDIKAEFEKAKDALLDYKTTIQDP
jgi:hypothetical protein